jgi:hypothetical protein
MIDGSMIDCHRSGSVRVDKAAELDQFPPKSSEHDSMTLYVGGNDEHAAGCHTHDPDQGIAQFGKVLSVLAACEGAGQHFAARPRPTMYIRWS